MSTNLATTGGDSRLIPNPVNRYLRYRQSQRKEHDNDSKIGEDINVITAYPDGLKLCEKSRAYKWLYIGYSGYAKYANYLAFALPALYRYRTMSESDFQKAVKRGTDFGITQELRNSRFGDLNIAYKQTHWYLGRKLPYTPGSILVDTLSPSMRIVRQDATTPAALHVASYDYDTYRETISKVDRAFLDFWAGRSVIAQATHNRLEIVTRGVHDSVEKIVDVYDPETINIASVASGSAIATIDGIKRAMEMDKFSAEDIFKRINLFLIDPTSEALKSATNYYKSSFGVDFPKENLISKRSDVGLRILQDRGIEIDIFEMNGLADYFTWEALKRNVKEAYRTLSSRGCMILSNITDNDELTFFEHALYWPMIAKDTYDFLYSLAGDEMFSVGNIQHLVDPNSTTYTIARSWKGKLLSDEMFA